MKILESNLNSLQVLYNNCWTPPPVFKLNQVHFYSITFQFNETKEIVNEQVPINAFFIVLSLQEFEPKEGSTFHLSIDNVADYYFEFDKNLVYDELVTLKPEKYNILHEGNLNIENSKT